MQVSFALHELTTEVQYAGLWQILRSTDDIWTATDKVCRLYEQPYYCNVDTRFRYAKELETELASSPPAGESQSDTGEGQPAVSEFFPYRMIDRSMTGADVAVLQAILIARGYFSGPIDGSFGDDLDVSVRAFQRDHELEPDGVVGPITWKELLKNE